MKAAPPLCARWVSHDRQLGMLVVVWWAACDGSQWVSSLGTPLCSVGNLGVTQQVVWCGVNLRGEVSYGTVWSSTLGHI